MGETTSGVVPGGALSPAGIEQAGRLGRALTDERIDLCAVSEFRRTQETADLVLEGRDVPRLVVPDLNEIRFGHFEGGLLADYRVWAWEAPADELCPGGGESRGEAAARYARAFSILVERPEATVLVIAHALGVRYLLDAVEGRPPVARIEPVAHAQAVALAVPQVHRAIDVLRSWAESPAFA